MEDAVQSLVSHLLSSSSTLPLKRLASPSVTTSPPASTSNILGPNSAVTTRPQGSTAGLRSSTNTHDQLIHVIRRPGAEPISCPTVSSAANPIQPVIFNLPLGNPGGLLIVRNPQPEPTVPVVTVSQPAVVHGWSQFMPRPDGAQPCNDALGNSRQLSSANQSPTDSGNFLLESPHISSKLSTPVPVDIYQCSSDDGMKRESNLGKHNPSLDTLTFDVGGFPTPTEATNFDSGGQIPAGEESDLSGGVSELCDDDKSTLPCDVLEDLLHIVNESLGPHADADYDLTLDDDTSLISMVVSPDSEVPSSTAGHDAQLAKIMDYCPEWSYTEVSCTCLLNTYWSISIFGVSNTPPWAFRQSFSSNTLSAACGAYSA